MNGTFKVVCLVLLAACAVKAQTTAQPEETCGIFSDSLAHPADCTKYYTLNLHTCPNGQHYDSKSRECVDPVNSTCGQDTTTESIPTEDSLSTTSAWTSTTTGETTIPIETTTLNDTTSSTVTTTPTSTPNTSTPTTTTPTTTTPTTTTRTTTTPTTTTPTTTTPTTTTPTTTTPTTTIATSTTPAVETTTVAVPPRQCPEVDDPANRIRYPHETDCKLYYLCVNGTAAKYTCGANQHFSVNKKACRAENEAGCDRCPDVDVANEVVRLPHETNCEYYYRCDNTNVTLYRCAGEGAYLFSRVERDCVTKGEAQCTLGSSGPLPEMLPEPVF